jgi:predicted ATPase/DNA-binding CsgD family transcriptional regulator
MTAGNPIDPAQPLLEPLTRREQEVLALLAEGLTGGEMAERLTLAVSSVRWYTHQIYCKLGVSGKRQAITRARELGLLRSAAFDKPPIPGSSAPVARPEPSPAAETVKIQVAPRHNLPVQRTPLIGRAQEVQQVQELLAQGALVTLTGSGGVGKTRLSLQVAETVLDRFAEGVWYVELAALSEPERLALEVAKTLGVREVPGQPVLDALISNLRDRQVLLVLDNCEHLRDACSRLADALLNACARLKILTSSREALGIAGEVTYRVPSLPFPTPGQVFSPENAVEYAAVRLFVIRARMARPGFQVTAANAASLARICQRLDGIPLAIELAAARTGMLTLEELDRRLDDAFRLLTGGSRSALPRQQTLRAAIDWSYALLNDPERLLFRRLAVFSGGCTLEAAEAVCSGAGLAAGDVFDRLAALVARSMVMVDFQGDAGATRYRLLETVRQYAGEVLLDSGESPRLVASHRDYFLATLETNGPKLHTRDWAMWLRKLEAEHDNLTLVLERSFSCPASIEAGLRFFLVMQTFWGSRHYLEPIEWYKRATVAARNHAEIPPALWAEFLGAGSIWMSLNDLQTAFALNQQAIEISRRLGPEGRGLLIDQLLRLVMLAININDYRQALAPFAKAKALIQQLEPENHLELRGRMLNLGAALANWQGKHQEAIAYARGSIQIFEKLGLIANSHQLIPLGIAYTSLREYEQARIYYLQALQLADEYGDLQKGYILFHLGLVDLTEGYLDRALDYCKQGLQEAYAIPDYNVLAFNLDLAARIQAKQGRLEQAAHLSGVAHAFYEQQGRLSLENSALDAILPGWETGPDRDAIWQAYEGGLAMSAEQAVDFALNHL